MKNREIIYQSLELMEKNLKSDITIYSISSQFNFSLYYFSRLFKGITGYSPKSYLLHRQITEAAKDLLNTKRKIIEIALDYGFSTPESFSRAFQKIMGCNPSETRKSSFADPAKMLSPITKDKIEKTHYLEKQEPEFLKLDVIKLVGIPFYYDLTLKNDLSEPWQHLIKNVTSIENRIIPEKYYQVQFWLPDQDPSTMYFFIAVEVSKITDIPIQFTAKTLPEQTYLKFLHKGRANTVGLTYQWIYDTWLPDTEYRLPHLYNFEFCGDQYTGPYDDESISEIYIPVDYTKP